MNDDGFLDSPLAKQINVLNRWQYTDAQKGWVSFVNFRYMKDEKQTGEMDFEPEKDKGKTTLWGSEINTERLNVSAKIGYVFPNMPFQSFGFQNAFDSHNQESYFGKTLYNIKQSSYYSNLIFNSIFNNTMNKFATGLNFTYDQYQEFVNVNDYSRIDNSVGAFFEYTHDNLSNFSFIAGGRIDNHNRLGMFITPRLHLRYNPWENGVIRASVGRGKRSANIFAENQPLFASSRMFNVLDSKGEIYGLDPEIAWNYGLSFSQVFPLLGKKADIGFDFYRTDFKSQVVVDLYQDPQKVSFYNLKGDSYANSLQFDFNIELARYLDLRTAYKYYDIQTDYLNEKSERPLQAKHRFFCNLAYETQKEVDGKQWKFDFTYNWMGEQKLPNTASRLPEYSPSYSLMNTQITRIFSSTFEVYVGGENIGNYTQEKAILGSEDPFGPTFDASIVYAPIFGQMYYAGLRFKIK